MYKIKRFSISDTDDNSLIRTGGNLSLGVGALGVAGGLGTMYKAGSDWKAAGDKFLKDNPLTINTNGHGIPELEFTKTGARLNAPATEAFNKFKGTDAAKKAIKLGNYGKYAAIGGIGLLAAGVGFRGMSSKKKTEK